MPLKLKLSEFSRNVMTISKGTVLSQAIIVAATPILTRLYGPDSFGRLALFASIFTILAGIFSGRYELSIVLPKDDATAMKLMRLTLTLSLALSAALLFVMAFGRLFRIISIAGYLLLLPLVIFLGTVDSVMLNWFARKKRFVLTARSGVINAAANAAFGFLLFFALPDRRDLLVYAYLAGIAAGAAYQSWRFAKEKRGSWRAGRREMAALAREYDHFPRYMVPTALLGVLSYQWIPILLKQFYPLEDVGFYSIANRFLVLPSLLLGAAIAAVFRVELAAKNNEGADLAPLYKSTLKKMAGIGGLAFLGMMTIAPFAFRLILGSRYGIAGHYARYLCLGVFGQFLIQPFGYVYIVKNKMKIYFVFQAALAAASALAIVAGHACFGGIQGSLLLLSALTFAISGGMLYVAWRVIHHNRAAPPGPTLPLDIGPTG